jgi:hypothetical protein
MPQYCFDCNSCGNGNVYTCKELNRKKQVYKTNKTRGSQSHARYIPFHSAYKVTALLLASFSLKSWMEGDYHNYHNMLLVSEQPAQHGILDSSLAAE